MITKYVHDLGFPLALLSVVAFVWTFLHMLKPPKQPKRKSLHDQRVEQWREYQKKQGYNIDEARKLYQEVATGAAYEGTAPAAAAKQRLAAMDSFTQKLVFKPMPRAKTLMQPPVVVEPNAPAQN